MKKNTQNIDAELIALESAKREAAYFNNLARISATILAAFFALLTFLLVLGVQNNVKGFSGQLYAAIIALASSLVLYAVSHMADSYSHYADKADSAGMTKALQILRLLQQLLFIAGIGMSIWFVVKYTQMVLNPTPAAQPTASQQSAPSSATSGPAPGETAEQHAAEQKATQEQPATTPATQ
jgi:cytochrome bd-type quinol oxidase subunit 2